ncbi:MAG: cobalt-precorrin 5A hydrolase, partial [Methanothrix sp.]
MVAVMAVGIVVRMICPGLADKWTGTPVVAVDSSLRSAVPVVGGHHGGNDLALLLFEKLGTYPASTTATDAAGRPSLEGTAARLGARIVNRSSARDVNLA